MARAKRTDRAEARRKYRAYLQAQEDAEIAEDEGSDGSGDSDQKPVRRSFQDSPAPLQPGTRLSFFGAAKAAYRTPHYLDDIKGVRELIFQSHAVWPVLIICLVSGAYSIFRFRTSDYTNDPILQVIVTFVFVPPLIPPMLAGFLAPRSTWLAGMIASVLATGTLIAVLAISAVNLTDATGANASTSPSSSPSAVVAVVASASTSPTVLTTQGATPSPSVSPATAAASTSPSASPSGSATTTTGSSTNSDLFSGALLLLLQAITIGAGIGALSGWYKRFLSLSSGGGRKPPSKFGGQRGAQRRRTAATRK